MSRYQAFDPDSEISGYNVLAFVTNITHEDIADILRAHGLDEVDPNKWYRLQAMLDVLSDIADNPNAATNLVSVGIASSQLSYKNLSPELQKLSLGDFLGRYEELIRRGTRSKDPGEVKVEKVNDHHFIVTYRVPYPDDLFYGFFYGLTRLFRPQDKSFTVNYDETLPRREEGGKATTIHIKVDA